MLLSPFSKHGPFFAPFNPFSLSRIIPSFAIINCACQTSDANRARTHSQLHAFALSRSACDINPYGFAYFSESGKPHRRHIDKTTKEIVQTMAITSTMKKKKKNVDANPRQNCRHYTIIFCSILFRSFSHCIQIKKSRGVCHPFQFENL